MKNQILTCILLIFIFTTASAQSSWQWAKKSDGSAPLDGGKCITVDENGNSYVAGYFYSPTITFDTITLINFSNGIDIFLAKYDSSGNVMWAKRFGGNIGEFPLGIALDLNGNIFITGSTGSTSIIFGAFTLINTIAPKTEVFTVKFDNSGNALWAKMCTGSSNDYVHALTVDKFGNCYVTGFFYGSTITFGSIVLSNIVTSGLQKPDYFIVKYDPMGNAVWAKRAGGINYDEGYSVTTDTAGEVYVVGHFQGPSITFGSFTFNGTEDMFVVKYDTSGNVLWAKKESGGSFIDIGTSIAVDNNKNIFVTGFFNGTTITIGNTTLTNAVTSNNVSDIFIVKYDSAGVVQWVNGGSGTSYDFPSQIILDRYGNSYIIGSFYSPTLTIDNITLINSTTSGSKQDLFLAKFSPFGNAVWMRKLGGYNNDIGVSAAFDTSNHLYITGQFESPSLDFDTFTLTSSLANSDSADFFIARLNLDLPNSTNVPEQIEKRDEISVYPNPSLGNFVISFNYSDQVSNATFFVNLLSDDFSFKFAMLSEADISSAGEQLM